MNAMTRHYLSDAEKPCHGLYIATLWDGIKLRRRGGHSGKFERTHAKPFSLNRDLSNKKRHWLWRASGRQPPSIACSRILRVRTNLSSDHNSQIVRPASPRHVLEAFHANADPRLFRSHRSIFQKPYSPQPPCSRDLGSRGLPADPCSSDCIEQKIDARFFSGVPMQVRPSRHTCILDQASLPEEVFWRQQLHAYL